MDNNDPSRAQAIGRTRRSRFRLADARRDDQGGYGEDNEQ